MINFANDIEDMQQKQITATYAEAVKAIKEAILESRYRAARLVNKVELRYSSEKLKALQGLFPEKSYTFISQVVRSMKLKQSQYTAETIDYLTRYSNNMISLSPLQSIDVIPSEQNKGKLYRNYVYAGA